MTITTKQFEEITRLLTECNRYLSGQTCGKWIQEIAEHGARRAVIERRESIFDRLREEGLPLVDEEV